MSEMESLKDALLEAHARFVLLQRAEFQHREVGQVEGGMVAAARQRYELECGASKERVEASAKLVAEARLELQDFQKGFQTKFGVPLDLLNAKPTAQTRL